MQHLATVLCLLVGGAFAQLESLTDDEKQAFLNAHNEARRGEGVGLEDLTWSDDLAAEADGLAGNCVWQHSQGGYWGENLMATSSKTISSTYVASWAVDLWMSEKKYNSDGSFGCFTSSCGHYTQVVWGNSKQVGCAISRCDSTPSLGTMVVCAYYPPGNYWGQKPY